jgi:hypothetical protein
MKRFCALFAVMAALLTIAATSSFYIADSTGKRLPLGTSGTLTFPNITGTANNVSVIIEHDALPGAAGYANHSSLDAYHASTNEALFEVDQHIADGAIHAPIFDNLSTAADSLWSSAYTQAYVAEHAPAGGATDADAYHASIPLEIAGGTEKVTVLANDLLVIEDSEAGFAKKRIRVGNLPAVAGDSRAGALVFRGFWNAATDTPALSVGDTTASQLHYLAPTMASTVSAGQTTRINIPVSSQTDLVSLSVRVTFLGGSSGLDITDAFIGHSDGAGPNTLGNQVRLTFSGANSCFVPISGQLTSDWAHLYVDGATHALLVAWHVSNTGARSIRYATTAGPTAYTKVTGTAEEASLTTVSGYTTYTSRNYGISLIEIAVHTPIPEDGDMYMVEVGGNTRLSNITTWNVGDLAVFTIHGGWYKLYGAR